MGILGNRKRIVLISGAVVVLVGVVWAVWACWPDPHLARIEELRAQLTGAGNLSAEQRRQLWGELRKEVEQLSPTEKRELMKERRERQRQQLEDYFKMSKKEKDAYLDRMIDRMEQGRRERQRDQANNGASSAPAGLRRPLDPEEREKRRRDRLDQSTPEERTLRSAFFQDRQARRQQRGLPTFGRGWGGR